MKHLLCLLLLSMSCQGLWALEAPPVVAFDAASGQVASVDTNVEAAGLDMEKEADGSLSLNINLGSEERGTSNAVKLLLLITVLAIAPAFLVMMTSFTRVIIVLGFVRRALGTNTLPPNQAVLGLALFLTMFIMAPTVQSIYDEAYKPYVDNKMSEDMALETAGDHVRMFMAKHTRRNDLAMFINISGAEKPETIKDVPFTTLIPAFITSELKTAFQMGFIIFLPFVIIDLVIAAILMALGMMMLPPVIISLPFKILLFVLIDGWALLTHSIVASYG